MLDDDDDGTVGSEALLDVDELPVVLLDAWASVEAVDVVEVAAACCCGTGFGVFGVFALGVLFEGFVASLP